MAFTTYLNAPDIYPTRSAGGTGSNPKLAGLANIVGKGDPRLGDSRVIRFRLVTSSRGAGMGQASDAYFQQFNATLAQWFGGVTETPWIPANGTAGAFIYASKNGVADDFNTYGETQLCPGWGLGVGVASNIQPQSLYINGGGQGAMFIFTPSGELHSQNAIGPAGSVWPSDVGTVGVKGRIMMFKKPGSEGTLKVNWYANSLYTISAAVTTSSHDITTTGLNVSLPANPDPIVYDTTAMLPGSQPRGCMSLSANAAVYPDAANASVLAGAKFVYAGTKQYGALAEGFGRGGWSFANWPLVTGCTAMSTGMGDFDAWVIEADNVNSYFGGAPRTAQQVHDTDLPNLIAYLRALADKPVILYTSYDTDDGASGAATPPTAGMRAEFDQAAGVCIALVDRGLAAMFINGRKIVERLYGYTLANHTLGAYLYAGEWSAAYTGDNGGSGANNGRYFAKRIVYHTPTNKYYWASATTGTGATDTPGASALWIDAEGVAARLYVAGDLIITQRYGTVFSQHLCRTNLPGGGLVAATSPPNPTYWGNVELWPIWDLNGRTHASSIAQRRLAHTIASNMMSALLGGSGSEYKPYGDR